MVGGGPEQLAARRPPDPVREARRSRRRLGEPAASDWSEDESLLRSTLAPGLRPQGVASGGFYSPGLHWLLFVLYVLLLSVVHAALDLAVKAKEVRMKTSKKQSVALQKPNQFAVSLMTTVWAIGTSAAAGALST